MLDLCELRPMLTTKVKRTDRESNRVDETDRAGSSKLTLWDETRTDIPVVMNLGRPRRVTCLIFANCDPMLTTKVAGTDRESNRVDETDRAG